MFLTEFPVISIVWWRSLSGGIATTSKLQCCGHRHRLVEMISHLSADRWSFSNDSCVPSTDCCNSSLQPVVGRCRPTGYLQQEMPCNPTPWDKSAVSDGEDAQVRRLVM